MIYRFRILLSPHLYSLLFFILFFVICLATNSQNNNEQFSHQLQEINAKISERKYKDAQLLLEKNFKSFKSISEEQKYALDLVKAKIQYYWKKNENVTNNLLKNLDEIKNSDLNYSYNIFLGQIFKSAKNFKKSILYYKKALYTSEKLKDTNNVIYCCLKIGSCFYRVEYKNKPQFYKNSIDSALFYYNKALVFPKTKSSIKLFQEFMTTYVK